MHNLANSEDPDEMWHFIRVFTICEDKKYLQRKIYNFYLKIIMIMIKMIDPKFTVLNQKEESISAFKMYGLLWIYY